jgi:hypothetical protein
MNTSSWPSLTAGQAGKVEATAGSRPPVLPLPAVPRRSARGWAAGAAGPTGGDFLYSETAWNRALTEIPLRAGPGFSPSLGGG